MRLLPGKSCLPIEAPVMPTMDHDSGTQDQIPTGAVSATILTPIANAASTSEVAPPTAAPTSESGRTLWGFVLPSLMVLSLLVLIVFSAPYLMRHWRMAEAHTEAEAIFLKRKAELQAEAEHAEEQLA